MNAARIALNAPEGRPCAGRLDLFMPEHDLGRAEVARLEQAAKRICAACQHIDWCRTLAAAETPVRGSRVLAGMTEDERLVWLGQRAPRPERHGPSRYNKGCRCPVCRAAGAERWARQKARMKAQAEAAA